MGQDAVPKFPSGFRQIHYAARIDADPNSCIVPIVLLMQLNCKCILIAYVLHLGWGGRLPAVGNSFRAHSASGSEPLNKEGKRA